MKKQKKAAFTLFQHFRVGLVALCAGTALQAALQVALAALSRGAIDCGIAGDPKFALWGAAMFGVVLLLCVLHACLSWYAGQTADRASASLRHALFLAAEKSSGERLQAYRGGKLLHRAMEDVRQFCDGLTTVLPALTGSVFRLGTAFLTIGLFHPSLALVLMALGGAILLGAACLRPFLRERQAEVRRTEEETFTSMQSYLQRIELLQSLGAEGEALRRFDARQSEGLRARRRRREMAVGANAVLSVALQMGMVCLLLWGVWQIHKGTLTYGGLTALIQLLALFRGPLQSLSGTWNKLTALEVSAGRLTELLGDGEPEEVGKSPLPREVRAVVFDRVTFRYTPEEEPVLRECSMRLDLRNWTCLNGFSGLGKSTVFKLILGIYQPQSGRVYLETANGEMECGPATRRLFAYVPQDYALFEGSILDNLRLVRPDADEQLCDWALEIAQADFIRDLPQGKETRLREQNSGLSMGQIQRLAIARAVLMERPILLLDECTSALDARTEQAVLAMLWSLSTGAVLVTHHPEALASNLDVKRLDLEEIG